MITIVSAVAAGAAVHDVRAVSGPVATISGQTDRVVEVVTGQVRPGVVSGRVHRAVDQADSDAAHSVTAAEVHMVATALVPVVLAHAMVCVVLGVAVGVAPAASTGTQVVVGVAVDSDQDRHVVASKQRTTLRIVSTKNQANERENILISTFYQMAELPENLIQIACSLLCT